MDSDDLSYEEEQLQIILINELRDKLLQEERKIKELQDIEYQESLREDEIINIERKLIQQDELSDEISLEEMRQIRIKRFS